MAEVIKDWDAFKLVAVPLGGAIAVRGLKRGRPLSAGETIAHHPGPLKGDLHSPINGLMLEANEREIIIQRDAGAVGKTPAPINFSGLSPVELAQAFKHLGLDVPEVYPGDPFIVQAFDPEPGLNCSPALFFEQKETIMAGLTALRAIYPDEEIIWAVSEAGLAPEKAEYKVVKKSYPYTLPLLVKEKVCGRKAVSECGIFSGRDLYFLGRVWRTGLPLIKMPVSLGDANYFVPLGARVIDLLTFANMQAGTEDTVIKNGLIRGQSLCRLKQGLGKEDAAIHLLKGRFLKSESLPCRHCGECTRVCPACINVERYASLNSEKWLNGLYKEFENCYQCGSCALACPSGRPLGSLVRLAEYHPSK